MSVCDGEEHEPPPPTIWNNKPLDFVYSGSSHLRAAPPHTVEPPRVPQARARQRTPLSQKPTMTVEAQMTLDVPLGPPYAAVWEHWDPPH